MGAEASVMQATEELKKLSADLGVLFEQQKASQKNTDERVAEATKLMEDLKTEVDKSRKHAIFPEFDPRLLKFNSSQKRFEQLIESRPSADSGPIKGLVEEIQRKNDELYLKSVIAEALNAKSVPAPKSVRELKSFGEWQALTSDLSKALDTATSGSGSEWVPTGFSQLLKEKIVLQLKVAALFGTFTMPQNPYTWPFAAARPVAVRVPEQTTTVDPYAGLADAMRMFNGLSATGNTTFTAGKLRALEVYSREWNEDTVTAALPWLMDQVPAAIAEGWEDASLNGDKDTVSHIDSDVTEPPTGTSPKTLVNGLRKYALETASCTADMGGFTVNNFRKLRQQMGPLGVRLSSLAIITSIQSYFQFMNLKDGTTPLVLTLEKYGQNATLLTGEIGRIDGIPIVISEFMRADMDATGVYSGAGNSLSAFIILHRDNWLLGKLPGLGVETERLKVTDQGLILAFDRGDLQHVASTADKSVAYGFNVSSI